MLCTKNMEKYSDRQIDPTGLLIPITYIGNYLLTQGLYLADISKWINILFTSNILLVHYNLIIYYYYSW